MKSHNQSLVWSLGIVGKGWAARQTLWYLLQEFMQADLESVKLLQAQGPLRIALWSHEDLAAPCSLNSSSLCAVRGAKEDTPIGHQLVRGYQLVREFVQEHHPEGVLPIPLSSVCPVDHFQQSAFFRRFGQEYQQKDQLPFLQRPLSAPLLVHEEEAFLFQEELFYPWWEQAIFQRVEFLRREKKLEIELVFFKEFITQSTMLPTAVTQLQALSGKTYQVKNLLLAAGAYLRLWPSLLYPDQSAQLAPVALERTQVNAGTFLSFTGVNWGAHSWAMNLFDKKILVYRHQEQRLLITCSTQEGSVHLPSAKAVQDSYQWFHELLHGQVPGDFPPLAEAQIKTGLRHKGIQRKPFWGRVMKTGAGGVFCFWGTYKNGLCYSFYGGKQLARELFTSCFLLEEGGI